MTFRTITMSLDMCPHCFYKKYRIGWLMCHDGGLPTCSKCGRKYKRDSKLPIPLAQYDKAIKKAEANAKTAKEREQIRKLDHNVYGIYLQYEC